MGKGKTELIKHDFNISKILEPNFTNILSSITRHRFSQLENYMLKKKRLELEL